MKPWVVFLIIFACFAVLYPKIFHPMIQKLFGLSGKSAREEALERIQNMHPAARARGINPHTGQEKSRSRHMSPAMHAAEMRQQALNGKQDGGGRGSGLVSMVLPVYGVGIVIYLLYMVSKILNRDGKPSGRHTLESLRQRDLDAYRNIRYDGQAKEFRYVGANDDDSDLEGLDEDYKEYLKKKRKQKRFEHLLEKCSDLDGDYNNMSTQELRVLQQRLLETEEQMKQIMKAMQAVSKKTEDVESMTQEKLSKENSCEKPSNKDNLDVDNISAGYGSGKEHESCAEDTVMEDLVNHNDMDGSCGQEDVLNTSDLEFDGDTSDDVSEDGHVDDRELAECDQAHLRTKIGDAQGSVAEEESGDVDEIIEELECESEHEKSILADGVRRRAASDL